MQYIDRNTDQKRIDDDISPLIQGLLENRQILYDGQDNPPHVTNALKYTRRQQDRRQTSEYEGDDQFINDILQIFDFDPLGFQVESWQTLKELHQARNETEDPHGAIFAAPTGFGKTEAFLGPLYNQLQNNQQESAIIVYPRTALLQDQLGRMLEHLHKMRSGSTSDLSIGVYMGKQPWSSSDVNDNWNFFDHQSRPSRFKLANCWCGENGDTHAFELSASNNSYRLQCEHNPDHIFTNEEVVLHRQGIAHGADQPDIILTTLESLELFSLKPDYNIIDNVDTIVLDEVHLYTGLRGAHANQIIQNVNNAAEKPLLWVGASATVDDPGRFAKKLYDLPASRITAVEPPSSDYKQDHNDEEHFYFLLSPRDGPGSSSMLIQQLMLLGHSMLSDGNGDRTKILSFIDSISQVNQKHAQLEDADQNRELWRYHLDEDDPGNWETVATAMDNTFIDEPLSYLPVYADAGFDSEAASDSDVLLSTSFLEVGIDVGDIQIISQYRTPEDLSSFVQRIGRAAREEDTDSHILVQLSNLTDDANMFYRAGRFLASELRTPLKTDNQVVEWIHEALASYYETGVAIERQRYRSRRDEELDFYEAHLLEDLGFEKFYTFLTDPQETLETYLEIAESENIEPLIAEAPIRDVEQKLTSKLEELEDEFSEIDEYIDVDEQRVSHSDDAFNEYLEVVREETLERIHQYQSDLKTCHDILGESETEPPINIDEVDGELATIREQAASRVNRDLSKEERVNRFEELHISLVQVASQLMQLQAPARGVADDTTDVPSFDLEPVSNLQTAVQQLSLFVDDNRIQANFNQRDAIYHLRRCLKSLGEYRSLDKDPEKRYDTPYKSLYYGKYLLRAAYYFDRFLNALDDELESEIWYVPPSYFESSGQYFTVYNGEHDEYGSEESIDSIVHSHAPFRSEYQSESGQLRVFLPPTSVEGDRVVFDFGSVQGDERHGMKVPESITTTEIEDVTGDEALSIVRYCPECLQLLDGHQCREHEDDAYGKVHSEPQVQTELVEPEIDGRFGDLTLCDVNGRVTLEGVSLNITPATYQGSEVGVRFTGGEPIEREIHSPDQPLGFELDTRGLVFDVSDFMASIQGDDELRGRVARYKDFHNVDYQDLGYHTAAHFLLQVVSDISGVNTSMLFYGMDTETEEIFVFERTEGGQGIVDLVFNELENNPGNVLQSINRVGYNAQVLNERLWADSTVLDVVSETPPSQTDAIDIVDDILEVPYPDVREWVAQEFIATCDRAQQLQEEYDELSLADAYQIKHTVAKAQIDGAEDFPRTALAQLPLELSPPMMDTIESMFYSPDIDGCVENLHLSGCISGHNQEDSLSYILLEQLRDHILDRVPATDAEATMFEHELPPAGEIDGTSIFVTF